MTTKNLPAVSQRGAITNPVTVRELDEVREQRKPWVAMGLILIAASAERMAAHVTGEEQALMYAMAAVAFTSAVVIGSRSRHRIMGKHLRRRFIAAVWGGASWLTYVAACGLSWGASATLLAVGCTLSLMFWRDHRIGGHAKIELHMSPISDDDMFVSRWKKNLSGKGPLQGTKLTEREIIKSGYRYTLELVPGVHTVDMALGLKKKIESGLQLLPGQEAIIEVHPDEPAPTAILTIVTKSTIKADLPWPGPEKTWDGDRGSVIMGPFADGEGVAKFSIYRKDGMFGGFIQGGIGSGKSRGIETIALAAASSVSHPTTVWFACGQDGASSPLLMEKANATATTPEDLLMMLDAALAVMQINGIENRQRGMRGFHPSPDRPGLLIIIDEFHNFLDHEALGKIAVEIQMRMARLIREARKAGVALILATQDPLLTSFGPGKRADVMRSNLLIGNGVMMRSETNQAKQVFKVDINARDFPELPGYGYLARPFPGDRMAPFRFYFVNDDAIVRWASSFTWRGLSPTQERYVAKKAGRWYADRHTLAAAHAADEAALLRELLDGEVEYAEADTAVLDRSPMPEGYDALLGGTIPSFDEIMKGWKKEPAAVHEPTHDQRRPLTPSQHKVLGAVQRGIEAPKDLITETGYSSAAVHAALNELAERGLIQQPRQGRYVA